MKHYHYVGPNELLGLISNAFTRRLIQNKADLFSWIKETNQTPDTAGEVVATFIIDVNEALWVADRHSEHVACAAGGPVLSAGEITFQITKQAGAEVSAVTNQSTGFCPEPASWSSVEKTLHTIGLAHPPYFTTAFDFRRCDTCGSINLIKEDWFVCGVCDAELPQKWNF